MAGGGRVDDHQVIDVGAVGAPLELGELPDLADAEQLAHARRGHREGLEQPARAERLADRAGLDPQVLLHRVLGIDRDREQALGELDLLEGVARAGRTPVRTRSWLASSATIVRSPRRAATSPSAVATVDLPTPPLPVTKIRRRSRSPGTSHAEHSFRGGDGAKRPIGKGFPAGLRIHGAYESPIASEPVDAHLQGDRARQPEGRRRQDHDHAEPRRGLRRGRAPRAVL